ncbi:MAG: CDP-glycerol glycerophosphotransferase family protein [Spirochaetaceae bacterium]|nr:CDP-glycerol glycerophosphotransferase family protein [Spirochaetaceae bacterium]
MLFSILIGASATLYFLARTFIIRLKVLFSGSAGGSKKYIPRVIYSEGAQYWNVFKPVTDEFEKREIPLTFFTSARDDPVFKENYRFVHAEYIGEGNRAFARLNFLHAGIVLMTTPGLDVYQMKRTKTVRHYCHVLHMTGDPATYRLFNLDYFDSILLTGGYQEGEIRELEKKRNLKPKELEVVGCSYLDVYAEKIRALPEEGLRPAGTSGAAETGTRELTVLVSPSWGEGGILRRHGEALLDPLLGTAHHIIIRPHPQSKKSEEAVLLRLRDRYREKPNLEWDYERENIFSLARADIMISDFSSVIFDFIFLCNKPVIYAGASMDKRPYDASDLDHELWQTLRIREVGIELEERDFNRIGEVLAAAALSGPLEQARLKAKDEAWQYRGEAGKRIADFMIRRGSPQQEICP